MTEQLDIDLPDADYDQSVDSDLCDDPDKCPIAACGCRWLQTGDAWADNAKVSGGGAFPPSA